MVGAEPFGWLMRRKLGSRTVLSPGETSCYSGQPAAEALYSLRINKLLTKLLLWITVERSYCRCRRGLSKYCLNRKARRQPRFIRDSHASSGGTNDLRADDEIPVGNRGGRRGFADANGMPSALQQRRKTSSGKLARDAAVMLHLRSRYVSKAAILTVPVSSVPVENRSPA